MATVEGILVENGIDPETATKNAGTIADTCIALKDAIEKSEKDICRPGLTLGEYDRTILSIGYFSEVSTKTGIKLPLVTWREIAKEYGI